MAMRSVPQLLPQAIFLAVAAVWSTASEAGVCGRHTCIYRPAYQVCSSVSRPSCIPEFVYPFGEQLQLTIETLDAAVGFPAEQDETDRHDAVGTIRDLFAALRECWVPPAKDDSRPGAQYAVRLSFKRDGEIFGKPRLTYVTPGLPERVRQAYSDAVHAAIERCTPLPLSKGLGGAIAGRPVAIRFVDRRSQS